MSPSPLRAVGRRKDGCWSVGCAVIRLPVVEVPAAVWLGGGRFCGAASPLLLIAGRGSVDGAAGSVGGFSPIGFPKATGGGSWRGCQQMLERVETAGRGERKMGLRWRLICEGRLVWFVLAEIRKSKGRGLLRFGFAKEGLLLVPAAAG